MEVSNMDFQFVNSTVSCPTVPQDLEVRSLIRKQAMKKVSAARKQNGNYGKHNLRQYPVFLFEASAVGTDSKTTVRMLQKDIDPDNHHSISAKKDRRVRTNDIKVEDETVKESHLVNGLLRREKFPTKPSAVGYELTSISNDFDLLMLSTLATLHVGRTVRASLSQNPQHLILQLRSHRRWSYLTYLPARYEDTTCLRDATDCVIGRIRQVISSDPTLEPVVIRNYVKALRSLQEALDCPKQRLLPEVLCATEVLALYELLDPSGETAWVRHAAGAARLIRLRGPRSYNTEFEKSLFIAQTIQITTEALLNGERCYLEQPAWQETYRSVIDPDAIFSDRSEIFVSLLMLKSNIPGLFVDIIELICGKVDHAPDDISNLAARIRQLRNEFLAWHIRYQNILSQRTDMETGSPDYDTHCKIFAHYLSCVMITSRMLVAVSWTERKEIEEGTQAQAKQMLSLDDKETATPTNVFLAMNVAVSRTIIVTADGWSGREDAVDSQGLIESAKLERWCRLLGRKIA